MGNVGDGFYLEADICGVKVNCLIDKKGATNAILHPKKYYSILTADWPPL